MTRTSQDTGGKSGGIQTVVPCPFMAPQDGNHMVIATAGTFKNYMVIVHLMKFQNSTSPFSANRLA